MAVRFYNDLIHGDRIVLFNFFYARREGICPSMTTNLFKVRKLPGERMRRDIFIHSFTLKPEQDGSKEMRTYARIQSR